MAQPFQNKVILITGARSGIGRATVIKTASLEATLTLTDINASSVLETQTLLDTPLGHTQPFVSDLDIASTSSISKCTNNILSNYSRIDHIFNCAGINPTKTPTESVTDEYWGKLMNTNLKGIFNITRVCIKHLLPGASIVNVSSTSGLRPSAQMSVYCATKAAIIGFSQALALELGPRKIRVNVVCPGAVETPTNFSVVAGGDELERMRGRVALGRLGKVNEIADVVAFLLGGGSRYVNGSVVEGSGCLQ